MRATHADTDKVSQQWHVASNQTASASLLIMFTQELKIPLIRLSNGSSARVFRLGRSVVCSAALTGKLQHVLIPQADYGRLIAIIPANAVINTAGRCVIKAQRPDRQRALNKAMLINNLIMWDCA